MEFEVGLEWENSQYLAPVIVGVSSGETNLPFKATRITRWLFGSCTILCREDIQSVFVPGCCCPLRKLVCWVCPQGKFIEDPFDRGW